MKASRKEVFVPVMLALETQKEVDVIYAMLNFTILQKAVGLSDSSPQAVLRPFRSEQYNVIHDSLNKAIYNKQSQ